MQDLVLICAGEIGEEMADNIRWINEEEPRWNLLGFIDDGKTGEVAGVPVLGTLEDYLKMDKNIQYLVATLDGKLRQRIMTRCKAAGYTGAVIIGERAIVDDDTVIGEGTYIGATSSVRSGARVGEGCFFEHGNSAGMDTVVGAYCTMKIFAAAYEDVTVGEHNTLDARCSLDCHIKTPDGCHFGTGTVILEDVQEPGMYQGFPGKRVD